MNCPSCKMETPEELGYCDFCKEPFRRKKTPPPKEPEKVAVPPEVMAKLVAAKAPSAPAETAPGADLSGEFADLDPGERVPEVPPVLRKLAWAFLAAVLLLAAGAVAAVMTLSRRKTIPGDRAPARRVVRPDAGEPARILPPGAPDEPPSQF